MTALNRSTIRRLKQIKQSQAVWEGDRLILPRGAELTETDNLIPIDRARTAAWDREPQCILLVDGSRGMVRAMDVVEPHAGHAAFVRALLQAMERPQSPAEPDRPQRLLVRDRELQFYLRGVLQDLDITVDYNEELPLIDEIFQHFLDRDREVPPTLPPRMAPHLYGQAAALWENEPWEDLFDHQALEVCSDDEDVGTLYAVVLGNLGLEKGIVLYRSAESLLQFRSRIAKDRSDGGELEETFLQQDCLFALFEGAEDIEERDRRALHAQGWPLELRAVYPVFGMLHPLEGGRPFLYEEEAITLYLALAALNQFFAENAALLQQQGYERKRLPSATYMMRLPWILLYEPISITITPRHDLADELERMASEEDDTERPPLIHEDLWPENTLFQLGEMPVTLATTIRQSVPRFYPLDAESTPNLGKLCLKNKQKSGEIASLLIQTSRQKASHLLDRLEERGGLKSICFNPAESLFGGSGELGLLLTGNGEIHLFAEFLGVDREEKTLLKHWKSCCKQSHNRCIVAIAMGITGATRGNPALKHILGCYEVALVSPQELGLGTLRAESIFDLDEFWEPH